MASFDTIRPLAGSTPLTGLFSAFVGRVTAWNDARVTRNALAKLSDHELDDLGLSRGDIDRFDGLRRY